MRRGGVRDDSRWPASAGVEVVVAGSDATDHAEQYLEHGAGVVLLGEGELTLVEVMDRLAGRSATGRSRRSRGSPAPTRRDRGSGCRNAAPAGRSRDLDALPFPAWDLVDIARYREIWRRAPRPLLAQHGHHPRLPLPLQLVRQADLGPALRRAQPGERGRRAGAAPRAATARTTSGSWTTSWASSRAGCRASPTWSRSGGSPIPFKCLTRADLLLREGTVDVPRAGGVRGGLDRRGVRARRRSSTRWRRAPRSSRSARPPGACTRPASRSAFFLQFGYPGETREDIEQTLQMVRDCRPDDIGMSVSYPLPGTPFHARVQAAAGRQAELGRLRRPGHDVRGPLHHRLLPPAPHRGPHRVPGAPAGPGAARAGPAPVAPAAAPRGPGGAAWLARWARLPLERRRLDRLARTPHRGIGPLPPGRSHDEAARPSPPGRVRSRWARRRRPPAVPRLLPGGGRARAGGHDALPAAGPPVPLVAPQGEGLRGRALRHHLRLGRRVRRARSRRAGRRSSACRAT